MELQQLKADAIKRMRGLLATNKPAPTDKEVAVMLEERLIKKYLVFAHLTGKSNLITDPTF